MRILGFFRLPKYLLRFQVRSCVSQYFFIDWYACGNFRRYSAHSFSGTEVSIARRDTQNKTIYSSYIRKNLFRKIGIEPCLNPFVNVIDFQVDYYQQIDAELREILFSHHIQRKCLGNPDVAHKSEMKYPCQGKSLTFFPAVNLSRSGPFFWKKMP